ncbi:hypothetical protein HFP89_08470 [Wenzhouxiangella sp. XN79A]|uniref:hypothetical protein n=1 Tax=Wenzhouxiangella sp. XN79A TaxID=2724193 RepID=UPI00144AB271|nr:hypothetical protein [Wenzhouxiangella sp. XN79A]NKI35199.1 hypothetical protein [Wenzhouxiangella sp. XN79A]
MNQRPRPFQLIACWFLSLLLLYSQMGWAVQNSVMAVASAASSTPPGATPAERSAAAMFDALERVHARIDESQFELDEAVFALDFDAESIVRFVSEEIHYQHYDGLLRAAHGTLIARAGNSLDQSVLLAQLLNDAGYEARVVEGALGRQSMNALLAGMFAEFEWPELFAESEDDVLARVVALFSPALADQEGISELARLMASERERQSELVDRVSTALEQKLFEGQAAPSRAPDPASGDSEAYFWTEYRLGPGDDWNEAHPAFGHSTPPQVTATRYFGDSIPVELQHRVRIEVFLRSETAGSLQTHSLIPRWERPAANAAYTPLTIAFVPYMGAPGDGNAEISDALDGAELFVPYFSEQAAPSENVFSLDGRVLPPEAMTAQGEFVKAVSDLGVEAVTSLSALGGDAGDQARADSATPFKLGKLWIEYSTIAPSGEVKTIERTIVEPEADLGPRPDDADGAAAWSRELRARLMQMRSLTVVTGQTNPNFLSDRLIEAAATSRSVIDRLRERFVEDPNASVLSALEGLDPLPETLWMEYLTATNTNSGISPTQVTFLHEPMLVSFNRGVAERLDEVTSFRQVDILSNSRRSYVLNGERAVPAPAASLRQGVYESVQEANVLRKDRFARIGSAFENLQDAGDLQLILPGEASSAEVRAHVRDAYRPHAERELAAGYALLVPSAQAESAWWRVDMQTGSVAAMGFGPAGYGGVAAAEYIKVLGLIIGGMFVLYNMVGCYENESGLDLVCCLAASVLFGGLIYLFMLAITKIILAGIAAGSASMAAPMPGVVMLGEVSAANMQAVAALINMAYTGVGVRFLPVAEWRDRICDA